MNRTKWDKRIRRAEELRERHSSSSQVLTFYEHLLALQHQMRESLDSQPSPDLQNSPIRQQIDVEFAIQWLPALLAVVQKRGPAKLAGAAEQIGAAGLASQRQILVEFLRDEPRSDLLASFFARALLQPCAEFLASQQAVPKEHAGQLCPMCGSKPQMAVLHPEGDGGKRHLACSLCLTEWEFRRILCPVCEEMDPAKLPRYSTEDPIAVRIEACETCKAYLKSFDMTVDGLMVPEVDEIATVSLDLWATEHGYHKIQLNLLGF